MKKNIILLLFLVLVCGCENKEELLKSEYIAMKNDTFNEDNYGKDNLPVDIVTTIKRVDDEDIVYIVTVNNPKENMHNIKALLVHNYYSEEVFPSVGVFDNVKELLIGDDVEEQLVLKGKIKTTANISDLNLELKLLIEYTDDNGDRKDIYYKTT